jgi:hypothetical protein
MNLMDVPVSDAMSLEMDEHGRFQMSYMDDGHIKESTLSREKALAMVSAWAEAGTKFVVIRDVDDFGSPGA